MCLKTETPATGIAGAGNVIIFPGRKATLSKISPPPSAIKAKLIASAQARQAYTAAVNAALEWADNDCSEESYLALVEARARLHSILRDGGGDAAA